MTRLHRSVIVVATGLVLVCEAAGAQGARNPMRGLSRDDLAYAMRDTTFGGASYHSNGTPRGDTARRLAAAGAWDLEGGKLDRGFRLFQAAFRLGVADSSFYHDAFELLQQLRCPKELVLLVEEVRRRWPRDSWADSAYPRARDAQQRATVTDQSRTCPLSVREPEI